MEELNEEILTMNRVEDKILNEIINQIVLIANPDKIILFGSRATGKANKDSDYDVLILKKYVRKKALRQKLYRTGLNTSVPVDMLVNTPNGFDKIKNKDYYVYYDIAQSGIVVYEKGG